MKFKNLEFITRPYDDAYVAIHTCPNGYGFAICMGKAFYSSPKTPYEFRVTLAGKTYYDTHITNDVIGWQTKKQIKKLIKLVEALPKITALEEDAQKEADDCFREY